MTQTTVPTDGDQTGQMVCLSVSYQGDAFRGIQTQRDQVTVAGVLEQALSEMVGHPVNLLIAGRTDANVHATRQVVAFQTNVTRPMSAYLRGVNNQLPTELRIGEACHLPLGFHPRYKAESRRYVYLLYRGYYLPSQWMRRAAAVGPTVNVEAMRLASKILLGEHDFSSFRAAGCQAHSPIRTMRDIQFYETGNWIMMSIEANAFLYRMVRKIMQSLINVGLGIWSLEHFQDIFYKKQGVLTLPMKPDGLYLTDVIYPALYEQANRTYPCWLEQWMRGE